MNYKEEAKKIVSQMTVDEKISQMSHSSKGIGRLGIPAYNWWNEGLHGVSRAGTATVFPQAIGLASSFNRDLMNRVACAISDEFRAKYNAFIGLDDRGIYKGLTVWSPNINIFRDPRWGRGQETYGEDPYLTSRLGAVYVKGLQGLDANHNKTDATLKHFAVHSGPESGRHQFDSVVNEKDLNETYLYAFKYCVDHAKPAAIMGAYNSVNGEPCISSKILIQKTLREKWGFEGYYVSDCGAVCDLYQHRKVAEDRADAASQAVNAGCDLCCGVAYQSLLIAYERGTVSEERLTESVQRLIESRLRLGMNQATAFDSIAYEVVACEEHRQLSLKAALESAILLKNNGILPLKADGITVSVCGPNADNVDVLLGNYNGTPIQDITMLEGIQAYLNGRGKALYCEGCYLTKQEAKVGEWMPKYNTEAVINAMHSDYVIACVGLTPRLEGEEGDGFTVDAQYNPDAGGDRITLALPPSQRELLDKLYATGKPVIVINISGSAILLNEDYEKSAAIIQMFYPGEQGGAALAKILFGEYSPSGKLPVSFYASDDQLPPFEEYSMKNRTYRYFNEKPMFPFGYGLTYSTIDLLISSIEELSPDKYSSFKINVSLSNRSLMDSDEVVQIYSRRLKDCGQFTPKYKLCGFERISVKAGECAIASIIIEEAFSFFNENGIDDIESGEYEIFVGTSQPDERSFELTGIRPLSIKIKI